MMNETRTRLTSIAIGLIVVCFTAVNLLGQQPQTDLPPNIVLIVSDDQGYRDLGSFGSEEAITPNLDRLANEGVKLTSFYVTWPACTPSRGSLLTGRYPQRHGVYDMIRNEAPDYGKQYTPAEYAVTFERIAGMDTREVLLPSVLKPLGYRSGIFGKWDLGVSRRFLPLARGFDEFYGFTNTGIDYFTHERYGVPSMYRDNEPTTAERGQYSTDLFRREAARFLTQHRDAPFFLYLPFNAPHNASNLEPRIRGAAQAPRQYLDRFPSLGEEVQTRVVRGEEVSVPTAEFRRKQFLASVLCMDDAIGEVLDLLDQYELADNTIVLFMSDNGGGGGADNRPLRGRKGQMFEGGIRVPCIIRFPGRIEAGTDCDDFLTSLEIFPTLVKLAGGTSPAQLKLDGFDMLPVINGSEASPREEMCWQRKDDKAIRVGSWKWVDSERGGGLFDLTADIGETRDLSNEFPDKLAELTRRFERWQREMENAEPRGPFRDY